MTAEYLQGRPQEDNLCVKLRLGLTVRLHGSAELLRDVTSLPQGYMVHRSIRRSFWVTGNWDKAVSLSDGTKRDE